MVQHLLLLVVAPPLLLRGRPVLLALRALPRGAPARLARCLDRARRFTRPGRMLGVFAVVILLTHLPAFYDATCATRCSTTPSTRSTSSPGC